VGKARRDAPLTSCLSDFRGSNDMASTLVSVFDSYFNRMYQVRSQSCILRYLGRHSSRTQLKVAFEHLESIDPVKMDR
jgi:hypothetical protein